MNDHYDLVTVSGYGGQACQRERVRAVGWENPSCPAGSVRVRREYPSGRSEVARWLASRAPPGAGARGRRSGSPDVSVGGVGPGFTVAAAGRGRRG